MDVHTIKNIVAVAHGNTRLALEMVKVADFQREGVIKRLEAVMRALEKLIALADEAKKNE